MKLALVLRDIAADLTQIGASFAVVGGIAASARGEPRFKRDVDVAVSVSGDEQAEGILFQPSNTMRWDASSRRDCSTRLGLFAISSSLHAASRRRSLETLRR